MKKWEAGKKHASFKTFTEWLIDQVPNCEPRIKSMCAIEVSRNLIGDTFRFIFPSQAEVSLFENTDMPAVEQAVKRGMLDQCGVNIWAVEAGC